MQLSFFTSRPQPFDARVEALCEQARALAAQAPEGSAYAAALHDAAAKLSAVLEDDRAARAADNDAWLRAAPQRARAAACAQGGLPTDVHGDWTRLVLDAGGEALVLFEQGDDARVWKQGTPWTAHDGFAEPPHLCFPLDGLVRLERPRKLAPGAELRLVADGGRLIASYRFVSLDLLAADGVRADEERFAS